MFSKFWSHVPPPAEAPVPRAPSVVLPPEVRAFLQRRGELNDDDLAIHLWPEEDCISYTEALRHDPMLARLGFIALDEGIDSNPYGVLTRGAAAGMVIHVFHDDVPRIEFGSLADFERHLRGLRASGRPLWESEVDAPSHPVQPVLAAVIDELRLDDEDEAASACVQLYLPLLAGDHGSLLQRVAEHPDLYVREALADAIARGSLSGGDAVLRGLIEDPVPQVRSAAQRGLVALAGKA